jgi:hypothetical protein
MFCFGTPRVPQNLSTKTFFLITNQNFDKNSHRRSETKIAKHRLPVQNLHTLKWKKGKKVSVSCKHRLTGHIVQFLLSPIFWDTHMEVLKDESQKRRTSGMKSEETGKLWAWIYLYKRAELVERTHHVQNMLWWSHKTDKLRESFSVKIWPKWTSVESNFEMHPPRGSWRKWDTNLP